MKPVNTRFASVITCLIVCLLLTGCDAFKSWFDTTATQTVIGSKERANLTKLQTDLRTIRRSVEVFHAQNGRYPDSLEELAARGIIHRIPREACGGEWIYDRYTGDVRSSSHPDMVLE
ncbi:type II secretion system protein GspG [bacterium]|nr:type II secretion system protein GspG [candidate division CSSED10-310 bacterium]